MPVIGSIGSTGTKRPYQQASAYPSLSGSPVSGQTLTCNPGLWTGHGITLSYQWIRNASTVIDGATSATYELQAADETHTVKCRVTATSSDANYGTRTADTPSSATITAP